MKREDAAVASGAGDRVFLSIEEEEEEEGVDINLMLLSSPCMIVRTYVPCIGN